MVDANTMREITDKKRQEAINEDVITLTQFVENEISVAANNGYGHVTITVTDYYPEAVERLSDRLKEFLYRVSVNYPLAGDSTMRIEW